jgi:hypothetical protein
MVSTLKLSTPDVLQLADIDENKTRYPENDSLLRVKKSETAWMLAAWDSSRHRKKDSAELITFLKDYLKVVGFAYY